MALPFGPLGHFFWQVTRVTLDSSSWQTWKQHLFSHRCVPASVVLWFPSNNRMASIQAMFPQKTIVWEGHISIIPPFSAGCIYTYVWCVQPRFEPDLRRFFLVVGGQRNSLGVLYRFHCAGCWPLSFRLGTTQLGAAGSPRLWCCHWRKFRRNGGFLFGVSQKKAKEPRKTCEWRGDLGHHQKMASDLSEDELSKVTSPTLRHQLCVLGSRGRIVPRLCYPKMIDMSHPSCTSFQRDFRWWNSW